MRKKFVTLVIITLILFQGSYILFPLPEIWPFSSYPMFSEKFPYNKISAIRIVGIDRTGSKWPLDIAIHFKPFTRTKLRSGIRKILENSTSKEYRDRSMDSVLRYLLAIYKINKENGEHKGPEIKALAINMNVWDWTGKSANNVFPISFEIYSARKIKH